MTKKLLFTFSIFIFCTSFSIPEKIVKKADGEIAKYYETENFTKENIAFSEEINKATISEFGDGNLFKIYKEKQLLGYGYIGNAPSKTATFDYLVLFDVDFIIIKSKVLVYREEYGGEIGSKRWLKQYEGIAISSKELKYNIDIIPISGATISVQSMTQAINDLLKSLAYLDKKSLI